MDKIYKIANVVAKDPWTGQYGTFNSFALQLVGVDGWVELSQKQETPAPTVGSEINGSLTTTTSKDGSKTYMKFKKAQKPFGSSTGGSIKQADIDYIIMMLEEATGRREAPDELKPRECPKGDMLPTEEEMDKPFDLSQIPF